MRFVCFGIFLRSIFLASSFSSTRIAYLRRIFSPQQTAMTFNFGKVKVEKALNHQTEVRKFLSISFTYPE